VRVFINYRRGASEWAAVYLAHVLSRRFGTGQVFFASRSIAGGERFEDRLLLAVRNADVLLAVVDTRWSRLTRGGADDVPAIHRTDDWVRREIAQAYAHGLRVVPVYVDDAPLLTRAELPADIADLAGLQGMRLRFREAAKDAERIGDELARVVPRLAHPVYLLRNRLADRWQSHRLGLVTTAVAILLALGGLGYLGFTGRVGPRAGLGTSPVVAALSGASSSSTTTGYVPVHPPSPPTALVYQVQPEHRRDTHTFVDYLMSGQLDPVPGTGWTGIACRWNQPSQTSTVGDWWYLALDGRWLVSNSFRTRTLRDGEEVHSYDSKSDPDVDPTIPLCQR
jgi:hypothetical protein